MRGNTPVDRPTRVRAAILRYQADNVQGHVAKVVYWPEPVADRDRLAVLVPLDVEVGVGDRRHFRLEVGVLTLDQVSLGAILK